MSTLTSSDIHLKRASTRVHAPPGGASSFSFGHTEHVPTEAPAEPAPTPVPAPVAAVENSPVKECAPCTTWSVGVALCDKFYGEVLESEVLTAFRRAGQTDVHLRVVQEPVALGYAAKSLLSECNSVLACAVISGSTVENSSLHNALTQTLLDLGMRSSTPVVPGILMVENGLEAKVSIPQFAAKWVKEVVACAKLTKNPCQFDKPVVVQEEVLKTTPALATATSVDDLLEVFRASLKLRGASGIFGLSRKFRIADDDSNGAIDFSEFKKVAAEHCMNWSDAQLRSVFDRFDADKSGNISFNEFLLGVRGQLNERRRQLVLQAFQILDHDKNGVLELSDIVAKYDASRHPDVVSGKRTAYEVLREFLDTFDSENKDGKVTPEEFIKYYGNVSSSIDSDDYFELMMRNAWHISGGEGWCANTSNRRVLVTHADGHQSVEEIKNDLGIGATDKEAMLANLKDQGITTVVSIDLFGSVDTAASTLPAPPSPAKVVPPAAPATPVVMSSQSTTHVAPNRQGRFARGAGQTMSSSITFG